MGSRTLEQIVQIECHARQIAEVLKQREQGEENPDLLTAALLHDSGKTRTPLRIWERVVVVIVNAIHCPSGDHP